MYIVSKRLEVCGSHRLILPYPSKCANLHGHNWIITVFCCAEQLNEQGMVCDFQKIKELIGGVLDHKNFNEIFTFNPTAENLARWVADQIPECFKVIVQESTGNMAIYIDDEKAPANI